MRSPRTSLVAPLAAASFLLVAGAGPAASGPSGHPSAAEPTAFGVADDTAKYADDGGAGAGERLLAAGLKIDRFTNLWNAAQPDTIVDRAFLDRALPEAEAQGIEVVLSVRPARASAIGSSLPRARQFAAYLALLARTYPSVRTFVVGNEPNQPRFWQPQFQGARAVAGRSYERLLALSYDALKSVDPSLVVAGGALSGRGNDNPRAASNRSTSPLRFLYDLGRAYRKSGRSAPLMDVFSFHPYPRESTDALGKGLDWPMAGYANLDRVKQAIWDAFAGTGQPTTENGLGIMIDEIGWQVRVPASDPSYTGTENVSVTTEAHQASVYGALVRSAVCDPSIRALLFMPLIDEADLGGFQSGLLRADGTPRPSYTAVENAIAATGGRCPGRTTVWRPSSTVAARAFFPRLASRSERQRAWSFRLRTTEDAFYRATLVPAAGAAFGPAVAIGRVAGRARANWTPLVRFRRAALPPGSYVYRVELAAAFNPARRRILASEPFLVRARRAPLSAPR